MTVIFKYIAEVESSKYKSISDRNKDQLSLLNHCMNYIKFRGVARVG